MMRLDKLIESLYQPLELFKGLPLMSVGLGPVHIILHSEKMFLCDAEL